jgi:hypothetical protein
MPGTLDSRQVPGPRNVQCPTPCLPRLLDRTRYARIAEATLCKMPGERARRERPRPSRGLTEAGPLVVPDGRIVGAELSDEFDLHLSHFALRCRIRLPENLLADREVPPLFSREVPLDKPSVPAPQVVDRVGLQRPFGRLSRRLNIAQAKFDPPELEPAGRLAVPVPISWWIFSAR